MNLQAILQYRLNDYQMNNREYKNWPELFQLVVDTLDNTKVVGNIEDVVNLIQDIGSDGKVDYYINSIHADTEMLTISVVYFDPIDMDKNLAVDLHLTIFTNISKLLRADEDYLEKALGVN